MTSTIKSLFFKFKSYLINRPLITDFIAKLVITFGAVLIVGGLYLMILNPSGSVQSQSASSIVNWVPGIPFYISALINVGASTIGLVSWIIGVDLLLIGLGLWVRHRLARIAAISIFGLSATFEFIQFLYFGFLGAPVSILELSVDFIIAYFLFTQFDSWKPLNEVLSIKCSETKCQ